MKPLIVLLATFFIALLSTKRIYKTYQFKFSARIALSVMLCFTAIAHFVFTEGMMMMLPDFFLLKKEIIYLTGILEIVGAIAIHSKRFGKKAACSLIVFFVLLLPANINAAILNIDYQNATYTGHGLMYLWFRIPLQILFIYWTYSSSIKK